jgi:hypothetical protein
MLSPHEVGGNAPTVFRAALLNPVDAKAGTPEQLRPSSMQRPEAGDTPWGVRAMIRKLLLPALAATLLAGCVTDYTYRGGAGGGDYYRGSPGVDYRYYGGYGGYGGGFYGGYPYYGYGGYYPYRYGYGYYGYPYYAYPRYPAYRYPYRHHGGYPNRPHWNGQGPRPGQNWNGQGPRPGQGWNGQGPRPGQGWNGQGPRPGQNWAGPNRPSPGVQPPGAGRPQPRVEGPGPGVQTAPRPRAMNRNHVQEQER